ncbi:MAG: hypothetical protein ACE5J2_00640 [Nitrososphaerales archaeon]
MSNEPDPMELRTRVDDPLLRKFQKLKEHYGITENSEMLRLLISEMYRSVIEKEK